MGIFGRKKESSPQVKIVEVDNNKWSSDAQANHLEASGKFHTSWVSHEITGEPKSGWDDIQSAPPPLPGGER